MTDTYRVYKCLDNAESNYSLNNPAASDPLITGDPPAAQAEKFQTADGYWWQFMYEVPVPDQNKFLTDDYIPVRFYSTNSIFDYNGAVESISVVDGGEDYVTAPSVVIVGDGEGATATATVSDGVVTGVTVTNGGSGYSFAVINFVGSGSGAQATAQLVAVNTPIEVNSDVAAYAAATAGAIDFVDVLDVGSGYVQNTTTVTITGDGSGATAQAVVGGDGTVTAIEIMTAGTGYSYATVEITSPTGVGATAQAIIGPPGGHGSNNPQELFATTVGIAVTIEDTLEDFFLNNEFRQFGLLKNPRTFDNSTIFTEGTGNAAYVATVPDTTEYEADDHILTDSDGEFIVIGINTDNSTVSLLPVVDAIAENSILENVRSGQTGLTMSDLVEPDFNRMTGNIIYIKNTTPLSRQDDQIETIKLQFRF
jgi:hypothetical protein